GGFRSSTHFSNMVSKLTPSAVGGAAPCRQRWGYRRGFDDMATYFAKTRGKRGARRQDRRTGKEIEGWQPLRISWRNFPQRGCRWNDFILTRASRRHAVFKVPIPTSRC